MILNPTHPLMRANKTRIIIPPWGDSHNSELCEESGAGDNNLIIQHSGIKFKYFLSKIIITSKPKKPDYEI